MNRKVALKIKQIRTGQDRSRILKSDIYVEEKLEARIAALKDEREFKKAANRISRQKKEGTKYKEIANLTSMINKNQKRLEEIREIKKFENMKSDIGEVKINIDKCKIIFIANIWDYKVNTEIREAGFVWSNKYKCWRAPLDRDRYEKIRKIIKKNEDQEQTSLHTHIDI